MYLGSNSCDRVEWHTVDTKLSQKPLPSSDPISPFTSSPADVLPAASSVPSLDFGVPSKFLAPPFRLPPVHRLSEPLTSARRVGAPGVIPALDDNDDDLPDVSDLLAAEERKQKAKQLAEIKRQALVRQEAQSLPDDDDDDDLVVESDMHAVADEEAGERRVRHAKHIRPSVGRKRQLMLGGIGSSKADKGHKEALARAKRNPLDFLKESARPAFRHGTKHGKDETAGLTPAALNRMMIEHSERDRADINKQKEEEWIRRGGKAVSDVEIAEVKTEDWAALLQRGGQEKSAPMEVDDGKASDENDGDWDPELRGSISPEPVEAGSGDDDGVTSEVEVAMDVLTDRDDDDDDDDADDKENSRPRRPRRLAAHRAVLDSDEDDDAESDRSLQSKPSFGQVLVPDTSFAENVVTLNRMPGIIHRGSLSSFDEPTEDENDKENNTQLMFDKSEDKENKAVVRHSPLPARAALGPRGGSLFELEERTRRTLSMSPSAVELSNDDHRRADDESDKPRSPLKDLRDDDDPFAFPSFTSRLQRPSSSGLASPPPAFDKHAQTGFSQFLGEDDEHAAAIAKSGLRPGFSDIFKSGSSPSVAAFKPSDIGGFSQWPEDQVCVLLCYIRRVHDLLGVEQHRPR